LPDVGPLLLTLDIYNRSPLDIAIESKNLRCIQLMISLITSLKNQDEVALPQIDRHLITLLKLGLDIDELL
jgi:hypothetical protein